MKLNYTNNYTAKSYFPYNSRALGKMWVKFQYLEPQFKKERKKNKEYQLAFHFVVLDKKNLFRTFTGIKGSRHRTREKQKYFSSFKKMET